MPNLSSCYTSTFEIANFTSKSPYDKLIVLFTCPRHECNESFLAYYYCNGTFRGANDYQEFVLRSIAPSDPVAEKFEENIKIISPLFDTIYNQALYAQQKGLDHICGPGYRKALEFLIKDYLIKNSPERKTEIIKARLNPCISNYVSEPNIKACAERAIWLGNDETHYERSWTTKDVNDLKILIQLTVNWINTEFLTQQYMEEMPKPSKTLS